MVIPCHCHRQADDRPNARSPAPLDLRELDCQLKFWPARVQSFKRAFALQTRELMAETEMNARAKGNVVVRPSLEIELLGHRVCRGIHVGGHQHGHDLSRF